MTKTIVTAALLLALAGVTIGGRAQAAAIAPEGLGTAADEVVAVDKVQFRWRGKRYCWYVSGWRGPGWYQCGFRWRRGLGWGGPVGWHGWRTPGRRPGVRPPRPNRPGARPPSRPGSERPGNRPGGSRPGANRPGDSGAGGGRPGGGGSGGGQPPSGE